MAQSIVPTATYTQINKALAALSEQRLLVEKAMNCGEDCSSITDQLDEYETFLNAFKREFFPDKP